MKKLVDLTQPIITGHWRYNNEIRAHSNMHEGAYSNVTYYTMRTHMFTHIDAQKHQLADGQEMPDYPLDIYIGRASFIDLSDIQPNEAIDAARMKAAFEKSGCEQTDRLILKTCWGLQRDWTTHDYWDDAPYITRDGAQYLASLGPRLVGYDFPQDYDIRMFEKKPRGECVLPVHQEVLVKANIMQIEYMHYLWEVPVNNFDLYALPLKLREGPLDGAQIRVIAAYEA